jgi:uncharacterized membrane protein
MSTKPGYGLKAPVEAWFSMWLSRKKNRQKKMKKVKFTRKTIERAVYILLIIALLLYGLKDSDAAAKLITALKDAFSILL